VTSDFTPVIAYLKAILSLSVREPSINCVQVVYIQLVLDLLTSN